MKKVLALLLAFCCIFVAVSCGGDGDNNGNGGANNDSKVKAISDVINNSQPTYMDTLTSYNVDGEEYKGRFETTIDKAASRSSFTFNYARPALVEEMHDSPTKTVSGTVYYKDGQVSVNEGDSWETVGNKYLELNINLDASKLKEYTVSEDGNSITAKVLPANAERVLGTVIDAEGDISVEITTNGTYLWRVLVTYTAAGTGAEVSVDTSYDYSIRTLVFPGDEVEE